MTQTLPRYDELLRGQRELPEELRQSAVLLTFAEPIKESDCGEFHRIHLTPQMLDGGEQQFYQADVFQAHRMERMWLCPSCRQAMDRINPSLGRCRNPECFQLDGTPTREFAVITGPVRGVCRVHTFPDFIVESRPAIEGGPPVPWVNRCLLVLDRRYHPIVLAAVYRTAGQLCEMHGWKML